MLNWFQFCYNFAFKFNLRRYSMEAVIQDMQHRYDAHETAAAQALTATQVAEAKAAQQLVDAQAEAMSLRAAEVGPGTECSLIGEREERERDASVCIRRHQDA